MRELRRLFGKSLVWGVALLQLPENSQISSAETARHQGQTHYEESIGDQTLQMRSIWKVKFMTWFFKKNRLWMDFKYDSKYKASISSCFQENQRKPAFPNVLGRLCGLKEWSKKFILSSFSNTRLEPSRILAVHLVLGMLPKGLACHCGLFLWPRRIPGKNQSEVLPGIGWVGEIFFMNRECEKPWCTTHHSKCGPG